MILIKNESLNPYYNLALEEYALCSIEKKDDILILWQNDNTIVIGRNQNTLEEINVEAVKANGVNVVRRITGGGAVYHDLGNLNFSYITDYKKDMSYLDFLEPVIAALKKLGASACLQGRNDLVIDGRKISGNAQTVKDGRILHHGTLLVNSDLERIAGFLNVPKEKYESKAIKSVRSRVANICEFVPDLTVDRLKSELLLSFADNAEASEYSLTDADCAEVESLFKTKYTSWNWNFGSSPRFNTSYKKRLASGLVYANLQVENGIITEANFTGDFLSLQDVSEIEKSLIGIRYEESAVEAAIERL